MGKLQLSKKQLILICSLAGVMLASIITLVLVFTLGNNERFNFNNITYISDTDSYISPSDVVVEGDFAYVADYELKKVSKINLTTNVIVTTRQFEKSVSSLFISGDNVYAVMGELDGDVVRMDKNLDIKQVAAAGHTPVDMEIEGNNLYVLNRFSNNIMVYNKTTLQFLKEVKISVQEGREPMAFEKVGPTLYIACHLPTGAANEDIVASDIVIFSTATNAVTGTIGMLNGTASVKDMAVSTDGKYLYVTNIFSRFAYPTSQLDRGWINTNGLTIIDLETESVYCGVLLDDVDLGAANPWGITVMANGQIAVALSGTDEVMFIDEAEMFKRIANVEAGTNGDIKSVSKIVNYANFLSGAKTRVETEGKGVRNITCVNDSIYVTQYFEGNVLKFDVTVDESGAVAADKTEISLGTQKAYNAVKKGEILWYDATQCYQEWESCNSCHPDARVDGFNWDNLNDGLGNPKQTKNMLYSHRTPPVMITAARPSAEIAVEKGMFFIQFNTVQKAELENIDEYLKSLAPTKSPYLNRDGSLTDSAKRGKQLFNDLSCVACHSGPNYTDMLTHDTKKEFEEGDGWDTNRPFDTPSLVEVWRTAPYLFNGKAATMQDAVKTKTEGKNLTTAQVNDLSNYILSIGDEEESYGVEQVIFKKKGATDPIVNLLYKDTEMNDIYIRKQSNQDVDVIVFIGLYDKDGKIIGEEQHALIEESVKKGNRIKIPVSIKIPKTLADGSYYKIRIRDKSDRNKFYATDFTVRVREG